MNENLWMVYALINALVFLVYGIDKLKAVRNRYRIPEKTLVGLGLLGPFGGGLGMLGFRHKIRKWKFRIFISLGLILHLTVIIYIFKRV